MDEKILQYVSSSSIDPVLSATVTNQSLGYFAQDHKIQNEQVQLHYEIIKANMLCFVNSRLETERKVSSAEAQRQHAQQEGEKSRKHEQQMAKDAHDREKEMQLLKMQHEINMHENKSQAAADEEKRRLMESTKTTTKPEPKPKPKNRNEMKHNIGDLSIEKPLRSLINMQTINSSEVRKVSTYVARLYKKKFKYLPKRIHSVGKRRPVIMYPKGTLAVG